MNPPGSQPPLAADDPLLRAIGRGEDLVQGAVNQGVERVVHPPIEGANIVPSGNSQGRSAADLLPSEAARPSQATQPVRAGVQDDDTEIISVIADPSAPRRRAHRNRKAQNPLKLLGIFAAAQLVLGVIFFALFGGVIRGWLQDSAVAPDGVTAKEATELRSHVNDAEADFAKLGSDLETVKKQISVKPGDAWEQLEILGARNELTMLADDAITNGNRLGYDRLVAMSNNASADQRLQDGAAAEISRVKIFYGSGTRLGSHVIPVATLYPSLKSDSEQALSNSQLIRLLSDQEKSWRVRLRAAYLLGSRRSLSVAEALVDAVKHDPNLDVVEECIATFEENTGYRAKGQFDVEGLVKFWTAYEAQVGVRTEAEVPES